MAAAWARVPLRIKLTLAFTGVMAVLLAAAGFALSLLVARNLDKTIDAGLSARAGDAAALVAGEGGPDRLDESGEAIAQLIARNGRVLHTTPRAGDTPLLTLAERRSAARGPLMIDRRLTGAQEKVRLYARPVRTEVRPALLVIGEPLAQREQSLESLHALLVVGVPLALLVASIVGSALSAFALRPVERMRRRAAAITVTPAGRRLPVPPAEDEIGRLGRTLNQMLDRLDAAFSRERAFVADASHELRTPLAILRTELELALRGTRDRDELEAAVRSAAEETDRLSALAEDLLVIARADQGQLPIRRQPLHADDLLETLARRFASRGESERRPVVAEPAPGVVLEGDPMRLEQALANMIENALRYGRGAIRLSAESADGQVRLHVRDRGPGFPPDFLPSAFERFSRADEARSRGGTGLGLAITAAIATAHGGKAHAANAAGGGADVWLELPTFFSSEAHGDRGSSSGDADPRGPDARLGG
jgi:two-component system, OmpR family, sensor kinase